MDNWRCECLNERIDNRPHFIVGGRQSGKTIRLIKEAGKTNGLIVCPTRNMAENVFKTACELGCRILKPITYEELFVYPNRAKKNDHYFDEYGVTLVDALRRQLKVFGRHNAKSIIIDEDSIKSLNDILDGLKVTDMDDRELKFKIEVLGRNESND